MKIDKCLDKQRLFKKYGRLLGAFIIHATGVRVNAKFTVLIYVHCNLICLLIFY